MRRDGVTQWTTYEQLQEINRTLAFATLTEIDCTRLENDAKLKFNDHALDRKVCVVRDTWIFPKDADLIRVADFPFNAMQAVLCGTPWVTPSVTQYYDCSHVDTRLRGLLLSKRAFVHNEDGSMCAWISVDTLQYLKSIETRLGHNFLPTNGVLKPPKFAIADCFVAGVYPEIDRTTYIERQAIGVAQIRGVIKVVYGGPGNVLQSHLLCWDNRNATIASSIPNLIDRSMFQLILAGPMTTGQELLLATRHECDGNRVREADRLLRQINPLYADITYNDTFPHEGQDSHAFWTHLHDQDDTDQLIAQARARQSTVARMYNEQTNPECGECTIVESQTVLVETVTDRTEHDRLTTAFENVTGDNPGFVARRSSALLKITDPRYLERLFPHLLTFGIGGLSMNRGHRYSQRAIVLHYLKLSTNRFAEDSLFKLVMFDFLSSMRVKTGVFLRVGQDPTLATTVMKITPSQLKTAMTNRQNQRKAWKQGKTFVPLTESSLATRVLKSINATTSKMWGSNEEREAMTRKVDSVTIIYGAPSVFWTLTPNPDCSITCAFWTGHELPHGRPQHLSECTELNMPCSSEMARLVMGNTVVQAQYYQLCCHILIDVLFGWDTIANKPKSKRGIFGFVEVLLYALEQQGRLFIHHHGVAWIAGLPKTQSDWDRLMANDLLRSRFEQYCESIFSAELPIYRSVNTLNCPRDDCNGILESVAIDKKYKHILRSSVPAPIVSVCSDCHAELNEADIVIPIIENQWSQLDEQHRANSSSSAVEAIRHKLGGLSGDRKTSDVQLSRLLLKDQIHAYGHARSCVKGRANTKCRYNFFRDVVDLTGFNKNDEIVYRRRVGNQWLNTYIPVWRRIFHFNMDARILWSGQGLQTTRYALQYTLKRQTVLDNIAVVELAFTKRTARESAMNNTEYSRGVGRLMALAYSNAGVMEIGGPLATAILMEGEAVTFSCEFKRLVLLEGLNILSNVDVEAMVISRNHQLYTETSITNYVNRPTCLENYSWYDYCCWFRKSSSTNVDSNQVCTFVYDNVTELGVHVKSHNLHYNEYPRVPEIIGPRLPDATRLGNEDYFDQTELYYRMTALLYCPFRNVISLLSGSSSMKAHFDMWRPFDDPKIARALERHQQYYICLTMAEQYRQNQSTDTDGCMDDEDICSDSDVLHNEAMRESTTSHTYLSIPPELYCAGVDIDIDIADNHTNPNHDHLSTVRHLLVHSIVTASLPSDRTMIFAANTATITRAQVIAFHPEQDGEYNLGELSTSIQEVQLAEVVVEAFEHATQDSSFDNICRPVQQLPAYASIGDVSRYFHLNRNQHAAFVLIAMPLLSAITGIDIPVDLPTLVNKSPLIVTGAGGTGKSQIIAAIKALATMWNRPKSIMVVASTGIAAASLKGCTMHSSVGLGINSTRLPKHIQHPTDTLLRQWAQVLCVIADEVSMIDLAFLSLWEESLRHAKDNLDTPYGGLICVLMFDHCQLRTVRGMPLYKTSGRDIPLSPVQDRGRYLYQAIKKVVYLTENMRFSTDPEWGQWLAASRLGNWTEGIRKYIQTLPDFNVSNTHAHPRLIQIISTDNATRAIVNDTAIAIAVESLAAEHKVYVISARLSRRVSHAELTVLRGLPDNKTGNVPIFLHVYIGSLTQETSIFHVH